MQTGDYWRKFENTGSIKDYLQYKGVLGDVDANSKMSENEQKEKYKGTNRDSYAGIHICDGNGAQTDRCR